MALFKKKEIFTRNVSLKAFKGIVVAFKVDAKSYSKKVV